jgi:hypothetical protein
MEMSLISVGVSGVTRYRFTVAKSVTKVERGSYCAQHSERYHF